MNNAYRTLARCTGYVGIAGCLLVGTPALAQTSGTYLGKAMHFNAFSGGTYIQTPSATHVYVKATGKVTSFPSGISRYKDLVVPVSKTTLRTGALAALGRGMMHPGLQVALIAAGYVVSNLDIFKEEEYYGSDLEYSCYGYGNNSVQYHSPLSFAAASFYGNSSDYKFLGIERWGSTETCSGNITYYAHYERYDNGSRYNLAIRSYSDSSQEILTHPEPDHDLVPVDTTSPEFAESLDPHIEPQLADELFTSQDDVPEWEDAITVLGTPASGVEGPATKNMPPEVASAIGKWAENTHAQLNGDTPPNPDTDTGGQSVEDQQYDENTEPPPPFPDEEVAWQTEIIDLPSFSSGIGAGSCPGSQAISLPGGHSMTIEYTPACDLATMVRPALIGICGMIALMIVLRARGGA